MAQGFITEDLRWVVDLELEKFPDRVNHDTRMSRISRQVRDVRVVHLFREFLSAGVRGNGTLKSAVDLSWCRKFLGHSFANHRAPARRIASRAIPRFKD